MIDIFLTDNRILIKGHAEYAPSGYDIVCAGISALTDTLVMSINELTKDIMAVEEGSGLMDIKFKSLSETGMLLADSFVIGAKAIADGYPNNVSVRDDRTRRASLNTVEV